MAKPRKRARYPAKFRATLEKVAVGREARETAASSDPAELPRSCWQEFLRPGTVHFIHTRLDDEHRRMENIYILHERWRAERITVDAPWALAPEEAADPEEEAA